MEYIDLHAHMVSRTTDDYLSMALSGCRAVSEPAFWAGYDRLSAEAVEDYFQRLIGFERERAAQYGIEHYSWLCLSPKETENRTLTAQVIDRIVPLLRAPSVVGIGETGLNRVTVNEIAGLEEHLNIAFEFKQIVLIHTPHLEDKFKGTKVTLDVLARDPRTDPARVLVDHVEEHTIEMVLKEGYWCGITLYPKTKVSPERAVDMIEKFGTRQICINSACDWGPSDPLAIPAFILRMRQRGHPERTIREIVYDNPRRFLELSGKLTQSQI